MFPITDEEEEKQEETTSAEEAPVPEVPMPAQSWERTAGGIKVTVEAPEGAFPENTRIAVTPVNGSSLKDTVSDAVDGAVLEVQAVDITFFDAEGHEIEPAVPIRVVMTPAATQHAEEKTSVVHVDVAQQTAELIEQAEGTETDNSEVVFDADAFTIYAIVYTVDFEYEVNGKLFTSSMPGAEDMPLSEIVKGLGIVGEEELETFLSKIASVTSTDEEVAVVTEDRSVRVLKDGDAQIVITMQDGAAFSISVEAEGVTEISDENEVATVSTVNDLYLPAAGEVKAELLTEEKSENAIAAVQTATESEENSAAAESASYQAFSIALENVDVTAYDGFNVAVTLPEDAVVGRDFQLYQVREDGTATDLTESLSVTGEPNEDGLQNVSGISFTTEDFTDFVLSYSIETFYTAVDGDTYKITLNYGPKAEIPEGAVLKVKEILPEDEKYMEYYTKAVQAVSGTEAPVQLTEDSYARFFDIEIWVEGAKIEPKAEVSVSITLQDAPMDNPTDLNVVHFGEGDPAVLKSETAINEDSGVVELAFETDAFSVYGVITTPGTQLDALNGRIATISLNNRYLTAQTTDVAGNPTQIVKGNNTEAAAWLFESAGISGQYYISTMVNGEKKYLNITDYSGSEHSANLTIGDTRQPLTVSPNGSAYRISATLDGITYYVNLWGGGSGKGFACWYQEDKYTNLFFGFPSEGASDKYAVVVKHEDNYYVVQNDGTLVPASYDPITNLVEMENPVLWEYRLVSGQNYNLRIATEASHFGDFELADAYYYRYIDPNAEDDEEKIHGVRDENSQNPDLGSTSTLQYDSNSHHLVSENNYIGADTIEGKLRITGRNNEVDAAEVYFARVLTVADPDVDKHPDHAVNHIDISVVGSSSITIPLAYGNYYDENGATGGNVVFSADPGNHKITVTQNIDITKEDIKRAQITAYTLDENGNQTVLDNAFYVTGYSGNGENDPNQVRIEGSFKVADLPYIESADDDPNVRNARLQNKIYYTISTVKEVEFTLKHDGHVLCDSKGEPITVTVPVTVSSSFSYWDEDNKCPGLFSDQKGYWQSGGIIGTGHTASGMDFDLGSDTSEEEAKVPAIEITKYIQKEDGTLIKAQNISDVSVSVYESTSANASDVGRKGVGTVITDAELNALISSGYSEIHKKEISLGESGMGAIYDYDVRNGMIYIAEDEDTVKRFIRDTDGNVYQYKETQINTEYVKRHGESGEEYHTANGYTSVPEVIGQYDSLKNMFLEFFIYNIYAPVETVDVPVYKAWEDLSGNDCDWNVKFRLQWAPLYEGEDEPSVNFRDVDATNPAYDMTIYKSDMAGMDPEDPSTWTTKKFENLPKYGVDPSGEVYRIQYSLDELEYEFTKGGGTYTWAKGVGWKKNGQPDNEEANHYEAFYPHDAGENSDGDNDYYILAGNHLRNVEVRRYIDIDLNKEWEDHSTNDDAWASFKLHRYVHTEYRDTSHMSDRDKYADPITLKLVEADGATEIMSLQVQPNAGVHLAATFAPHTDGIVRPLTFTVGGTEYTITSSPSNAGKETKRSSSFYFDQDTTIVITGGQGYLDGGYSGAQILDTRPSGTDPVEDTSYDGPVITLSKNGSRGTAPYAFANWHAELSNLLQYESSSGGDDDNNNVTVYSYYFTEEGCYPADYTARFVKDGTSQEDGTEANRIYTDGQTIKAINEPKNPLVVKKFWRGVPDTTGYPEVTFTLYQAWLNYDGSRVSDSSNDAHVYVDSKGNSFDHIPLNEENGWTWICPEILPTQVYDANAWNGSSNGMWRNVGYYVKEDNPEGQVGDNENYKWFLYYYSDGGNKHANAGQPYNAGIVGNSGTIAMTNRMQENAELDIKKQFFMQREAGSWANITNDDQDEVRKSTVLGFKVIRRVRDAVTKEYLTGWLDYGSEMKVGYNENGVHVIDSDNIFFVYKMGDASWEFQIHNNYEPAGGYTEQVGLPKYGFYKNGNGESIAVDYEYSIRETNVYKYLGIENGTLSAHGEWYGHLLVGPYDGWNWFSSLTPGRYTDADGVLHNNEEAPFIKVFHGQDTERICNFQASDINITKIWSGNTTAREVYVKLYRTYEQNGATHTEDFTHIIAQDVKNNQNWQDYLEDVNDIDADREWLVLRNKGNGQWTVSSILVNSAVMAVVDASSESAPQYSYYIEEVGYMDKFGGVHTDMSQFNPVYSKLEGGNWVPSDEAITLGEKGTNGLAVTNDTNPKSSFEVKKTWAEGFPTDNTQASMKLQQRYRYERIFYDDPTNATGAKEYVWIGGDNNADITNQADYDNQDNWKLKSEIDAMPETSQRWLTNWEDTGKTAILPVEKPDAKPEDMSEARWSVVQQMTDDQWKATSEAWSYTWAGLPATSMVDGAEAVLYYRALETGNVPYNHAIVNNRFVQEDYTGVMAEEDQMSSESIVNNPTCLQLEVEKAWTKNGSPAEWPEGYTVEYTLYQDYHLVESAAGNPTTYTVGDVFKSVPLNLADSWNAGITGSASGTLEASNPRSTLTGVPGRTIYTATAEDVTEAADCGVTLTEGMRYLVEFTYHAVETVVHAPDGKPAYTVESTIVYPAVRSTTTTTEDDEETEQNEEVVTEDVNGKGEPIYRATITNDYTDLKITKVWKRDGETITDNDGWPEGDYKVAWKVIRTIAGDTSEPPTEVEIANSGTFTKTENEGVTTIVLVEQEGNTDRRLTKDNPSVDLSYLPTHGIVEGESVEYVYSVVEDPEYSEKPAASKFDYTAQGAVPADGTGDDAGKKVYTLTNELTEVEVTKTWEGDPYSESVTVKLYRTTDIPEDQLCQVTVNVSFDGNNDKITDNTITGTVAGKTVTLTKDDDSNLWTGTVGLERGSSAELTFTTPQASDGYTVTLNGRTIDVADAETQTVDITGTVTAAPTGRTITVALDTSSVTTSGSWGFWGPQIEVAGVYKDDMQSGVPYNLSDGNAHTVQFGVWGDYPKDIILTLGNITMTTANGSVIHYTVPAGVDNVTVTGGATQEGGGQQGGGTDTKTLTYTVNNNSSMGDGDGFWFNVKNAVYNNDGNWWGPFNSATQIGNFNVSKNDGSNTRTFTSTDGSIDGFMLQYGSWAGSNTISFSGTEVKSNGSQLVFVPVDCTDFEITINPSAGSRAARAVRMQSLAAAPMSAEVVPTQTTVELSHGSTAVATTYENQPDVSGMGDPIDEQVLTVNSKNADGTVSWYYKWSDLPSKDPETGATYHYYVVEEVPTGTKKVTYTRTESDGTTVTIHNEPVDNPQYASLVVTKRVVGENNEALNVSRDFTIRLKRGDQFLKWTNSSTYDWVNDSTEATIWTFNNGGTVTFTGLDLDHTYTVVEDTGTGMVEISGYDFSDQGSTTTASVSVAEATEYTGTITNKYTASAFIKIIKVEKDHKDATHKLTGAKFQLIKVDENGHNTSEPDAYDSKEVTVDGNGELTFTGLRPGRYKLEERKAPDGYVLTEGPWYFTVNAGTATLDAKYRLASQVEGDDHPNEFWIENTPGAQLPQTGGIGTTLFTAFGGLMTATAGAILTIRRKRKPAEG